MLPLTGGEALCRALLPEQVSFVFGLVGGKLAPFVQAVSRQPNMRFIGTRHEGAAAMMAAAVSAASDKVAVVIAECGGGAGNIIPGITIANANNLPMLVLTSNNQHFASYPERGMFAGLTTDALMRPITKWNAVVHEVRRIPELVRWALREAFTGRPGPVHLDIPQDVLRGTFDFDGSDFPARVSSYRLEVGPAPTEAQVVAAADLLANARRPLLIAGGGVTRAQADREFNALVVALNAAAIATQMGNGNVRSTDPRYIGLGWVAGGDAIHRACSEADVVLAVGCRFSSWLCSEAGPLVRHGPPVIHIDVNPAVIGQNVTVAVGICADAKVALQALLPALRQRLATPPERSWLSTLSETYKAYRGILRGLSEDRETVMHPASLAQHLAQWLPQDALITFDGGHTSFWSNDFTPVFAPRTRFNEPGMTHLGFGLPWAIALKLLHPHCPVFNITGDGAFGFTLQELDTARRYGLPVINVIHNNASWGIIKFAYARAGFDNGTDLSGTDYASIAAGFGAFGERVERVDQIKPALQRAVDSGLPAVLDCRVRFEPHPALPAFARMSSAGA